jgi:hypothetical protein
MTIAFPDVCHTPAPPGPAGPGGVPIPYPNFAQTAVKTQQQSGGGAVSTKTPVTSKTPVVTKQGGSVNVQMGSPNVISERGFAGITGSPAMHNEIAQLKSALSQLHSRLQSLRAGDPDEWQKVLQDYAVAASALYVTMRSG